MPAGRTCARCGAALASDVRWCLRCHEPVREFTPRARLYHGDVSSAPVHDRPTSRWAASATTFGPVGRLVITAVLLGFGVANLVVLGATPFGLWFLLGFAILASFVLRSTWQAVPVERRQQGRRDVVARRFPRLAAPIPRRAWLVLAIVPFIGALIVWTDLNDVERFFAAAGVIAFGVGCLLGRANGV